MISIDDKTYGKFLMFDLPWKEGKVGFGIGDLEWIESNCEKV